MSREELLSQLHSIVMMKTYEGYAVAENAKKEMLLGIVQEMGFSLGGKQRLVYEAKMCEVRRRKHIATARTYAQDATVLKLLPVQFTLNDYYISAAYDDVLMGRTDNVDGVIRLYRERMKADVEYAKHQAGV